MIENRMRCFAVKFNLCVLFLCCFNVYVKCNFTNVTDGRNYNFSYSFLNEDDVTGETTAELGEASNAFSNFSVELRLPTECETPNYDPGWCIEIQQCPILLSQLSNNNAKPFLVASRCGPRNEDNKKPRVCCGKYNYFRQTIPLGMYKIGNQLIKDGDTTSDWMVDDNTIFPKKCGNQRTLLNSRILGGSQAEIGEFPWMARLIHKNQHGFKSVGCAAFLIHSKYVLSAAHCVDSAFTKFRGPVFSVILGEHNTETKVDCDPTGMYCAAPLQISRAAKVIAHPGYDNESPGHYNDIALIHLKKGARITEFVQPICLQVDHQGRAPDAYVISGWGKTEEAQFSKVKMKLEVPPFDNEKCAEKFSMISIDLVKTQMCAGGEAKKDSCGGDSGGPLMFHNGTNWFAEGLVSYGIGCGIEGWPGVYTNISSFIPWIKEEIFKNSLISARNPGTKKHHKRKNDTTTEQLTTKTIL